MSQPTLDRPDHARIDRILRGLENAWKVDRELSFGELLARILMVQTEDPIVLPYLDDVTLEMAVRQHLAYIMRSSRDP